MNELIEDLWNRELEYNSIPMDFIEFRQAIQTACKAQRNACVQAYKDECISPDKWRINAILNAEIRKEDYE